MDETGVQEGEGSQGTVIGSSSKRRTQVGRSDATHWVSIIEYIGVTSGRGTPVIIYSGQRVQAQWFKGNIPEWEYSATKKGWSNRQIANRWMDQVFLPETLPRQPDEWRLLLLDGYTTHIHPEFMWKAYSNRVALVYLPPHASDKLQPLDIGVFLSLKSHYRQALREYATFTATAPIYKQRMLQAYDEASQKAFTDKNIKSGWRRSGLLPFNPETVVPTADKTTLEQPEPYIPDTPVHRVLSPDIYTPEKAKDLIDQFRVIQETHGRVIRDFRSLVGKAGKTIATRTAEIGRLRVENHQLTTELEKYQPDKRQAVETDQNNVFCNLTSIRSAEDKRKKRLAPPKAGEQLEIDQWLENMDYPNKRPRNHV